MDLAFADKLASQNSGVKYLIVAEDIFSRFVRVQTKKTKSFYKLSEKLFLEKILVKNIGSIKNQNKGELLQRERH